MKSIRPPVNEEQKVNERYMLCFQFDHIVCAEVEKTIHDNARIGQLFEIQYVSMENRILRIDPKS